MPTYLYKAKKGISRVLKGEVEAASRHDALAKIDSLGLFPVYVEEKHASLKIPAKISLRDLVEFTNQLSTLINSGSTLLSALDTLVTQTEQTRIKPIIADIASEVKEGVDFSTALAKYPRIFSQLYVALVKIGESSGTLGGNLRRVAEVLEEELDFKTNITSILIYPLLIVAIGLLTVFVLLKFVIPKLVAIFYEMGQALPLATSILVGISDFFSKYWLAVFALLALLVFVVKNMLKKPANRLRWDKLKLTLPLFGNLLSKIEICRIARTLSVLLKNGVPLDAALNVLKFTTINRYLQNEMSKILLKIKDGFSLNRAMRETEVFNSAFINVVTIGEDSGTLENVLEEVSYDYNKQVSRGIKNLLNVLEPLLILGVGLIVGFVVLSMLLPIFQIDFNF